MYSVSKSISHSINMYQCYICYIYLQLFDIFGHMSFATFGSYDLMGLWERVNHLQAPGAELLERGCQGAF